MKQQAPKHLQTQLARLAESHLAADDRNHGFRISIDIGGTFTDAAFISTAGETVSAKAPTTAERAWIGVRRALEIGAESYGLSLRELLTETTYLLYSTTRATNAILEERTARTGLLVTAGFPDVLLLKEGGKEEPFNLAAPFPSPFVTRNLTFEVRERISAEGAVVRPLEEQDVCAACADARRLGVEAIAICFLWSVANPEHELRARELIARELPDLPITLSHELNPVAREYRRASSAAIDASLKPLMQRHLADLAADLSSDGFSGLLLVANSMGGMSFVEDIIDAPIRSVGSGPSLAPISAIAHARSVGSEAPAFGGRDIIVCDAGGTSFDVSLVRGGQVLRTRDTWLGSRFTGHLTGLPSVDTRSVGAGGGSVAWIDEGGLLRVGPASAGSNPGPACYDHGGQDPTVTDAALVLGYIDANRFAGGRIQLNRKMAERAVQESVAGPLRIGILEASAAIMAVATQHMVAAIRELTIGQGFDPRESSLVAGGGAAGLNVVAIARELGCNEILVPRTAGVLSADGGLYADLVTEASRSHFTVTSRFDRAGVRRVLQQIDAALEDFVALTARLRPPKVEKTFVVEARYVHQLWELEVPIDIGTDAAIDPNQIVERFHSAHEEAYAVREAGQDVECLRWLGRARVNLPTSRAELVPRPGEGLRDKREGTTTYFPELGEISVTRYAGAHLPLRALISGPCVLDDPHTTVVIEAGASLQVTLSGDYLIHAW